MYKHILIATDGSPLSGIAVDHGVGLARALGARVSVVTVTEPFAVMSISPGQVEYTREEYERRAQETARQVLDQAAARASAAGVACETVSMQNDQPWQAIIDTAVARHCDAIVMASHGRRGVSALLLGSETVKVLTHSRIPVLVCR